ncbi:hypothetical protein BU23DRAFT_105 [Bimuria novae-zelandiae CBS 107.79]|uniref:Calcineurin-like phosphoesterase domain-containing protein n=1 Tax=Bimuria novae-zelandiae CBS 107.79 TaxID=1447943 RepID=A0A6A5VTT6_9PLEO|nr:hypothetical protein BU23DRAFT_105 [Bimuria novae-zelandiae CBS 107.79]
MLSIWRTAVPQQCTCATAPSPYLVSPLTPKYGNWAFQYPVSPVAGKRVWNNLIPKGADIVITHGPPLAYLDVSPLTGTHAGCPHLTTALHAARPELFVCGHIHEARGRETVRWDAVNKMYDAPLGVDVGGWFLLERGVLSWVWEWVGWIIGREGGGRRRCW